MAPITTVCNDPKTKQTENLKQMEKMLVDDEEKENLAEAIKPTVVACK